MTYTEHGDEVVLQMSLHEFQQLSVMLGSALLASVNHADDFRKRLDFINRLNASNPNHKPLTVPEELMP